MRMCVRERALSCTTAAPACPWRRCRSSPATAAREGLQRPEARGSLGRRVYEGEEKDKNAKIKKKGNPEIWKTEIKTTKYKNKRTKQPT